MYYLALLKLHDDDGDHVYLMSDQDQKATVWESEYDALRYFEKGYNNGHGRSFEGSMSACIHFIQFQPRIISIKNEKELQTLIDFPVSFHSLSSVAGSMGGFPVNNKGEKMYEKGRIPKLIE